MLSGSNYWRSSTATNLIALVLDCRSAPLTASDELIAVHSEFTGSTFLTQNNAHLPGGHMYCGQLPVLLLVSF